MAMTIDKRQIGERWTVLTLVGQIDMVAAPGLAQACRAELRAGLQLALDLSGVTYLSSAGLRAILGTAKELGPLHARLALVGPQPVVRDTLEISGFARFLPVVASLQSLE
jgi:anti-sigma B factor antagonist